MKSAMKKTSLREIRHSLGRYLAIFFIVALGVIMFAGLRVCREDMVATADKYFKQTSFYDYRALSTLGFDMGDAKQLVGENGVLYAQGGISQAVIELLADGRECVVATYSLLDNINRPELIEGRMPENDRECVVDSKRYGSEYIGQEFVVSDSNTDDVKDAFTYSTYTIVGIVQSPLYLNFDRGTAPVGNGSVSSFAYFMRGAYTAEYDNEIYVRMDCGYEAYSDEYNSYVDEHTDMLKDAVQSIADKRYTRLYSEAYDKIEDAKAELNDELEAAKAELDSAYNELLEAEQELEQKQAELDANRAAMESMGMSTEGVFDEAQAQLDAARQEIADGYAEYESGIDTLEANKNEAENEIMSAEDELNDLKEPVVYVLARDSNVGYASFDNDSNIVNQVAAVFPIFFFAVAALVCMTTMTRMVEDERTQIGVLKALGYSDGAVMAKYMFYSGSAAVGGAVFGYVVGNLLFPKVIWMGYNMLYDFAGLTYVWDIKIGVISIVAAVLCSMGATYFSCAAQFHSSPATLIRPKAPKSGKRILLERVGFIWRRLGFLRKVSIRNVFRYKKRFIMMIMGIGGCTALVVTALGLKDSFSDIVSAQFREIAVYDMSVTLGDPADDVEREKLGETFDEYFDSYAFLNSSTMDIESTGAKKSANVIIAENAEELSEQYHFMSIKGGERFQYPSEGEIILTKRLAKNLGVKKGDTLTLTDDNLNTMTVTVSGVCKNYVFNYAFIAKETYIEAAGGEPEYRTVYASIKDGLDAHQTIADLLLMDEVSSAYANADTQEQFDSMISSINYVVVMVIVLAAALAFVVLYNLTNINITERIREIATIKVLGFYSWETASYVFRENFILTGIGAVLGLGLGKLLHIFIMNCINVEAVSFDSRITWLSYVLSVVLTFIFAVIVNLLMLFKLNKINMAESLKSVE